jgi:DNA-binding NtrC family response regulator
MVLLRDCRAPSPTVLAVDDDPLVLTMLINGLQSHRFAVFPASGGAEAIKVLRAHSEAITVALVDLNMPEFDGLATLQELLKIKPRLGCCLMSEEIASLDEAIPSCGAACIVGKPFVLQRLVEQLRKLHTEALHA